LYIKQAPQKSIYFSIYVLEAEQFWFQSSRAVLVCSLYSQFVSVVNEQGFKTEEMVSEQIQEREDVDIGSGIYRSHIWIEIDFKKCEGTWSTVL
jgi:hypothetical protein